MNYLQGRIIAEIAKERSRQDDKWGEQNHDPITWATILTEEVGEFAQAALQNKFGGNNGGMDHLREEAIQTAAVAMAIVECLDRGNWGPPTADAPEKGD